MFHLSRFVSIGRFLADLSDTSGSPASHVLLMPSFEYLLKARIVGSLEESL